MKFNATIQFAINALLLLHPTATLAAGIRGGQPSMLMEVDEEAQITRHLKKNVTDLKLCARPASTTSSDKYFWMSIVNRNKEVTGSCLLTIKSGTTDNDYACCMANNGAATEYSNSWSLVVADPHTITSGSAYSYCGKEGGSGCPNYDYSSNELGMARFKVEDGSNDDNELAKWKTSSPNPIPTVGFQTRGTYAGQLIYTSTVMSTLERGNA